MEFSSLISILLRDDSDELEKYVKTAGFGVNTSEFAGKIPKILLNSPPIISLSAYFHAQRCFEMLSEISILSIPDEKGLNVAHFAAAAGENEIIENISNSHLELITKQDDDGNTPLHYAAMFGRTETCKNLIKLGCSPNSVNKTQQMPLDYAVIYGFSDTVLYLGNEMKFKMQKNAWKEQVLNNAIKSESFETVKVVVESFSTKVKMQNIIQSVSCNSALIYQFLSKKVNSAIPLNVIKGVISKNNVQMYKAFLKNNRVQLDYSMLVDSSPLMIKAALDYEENEKKYSIEETIKNKTLTKHIGLEKTKGALVESLLSKPGNTQIIKRLIESGADFSKNHNVLNVCAINNTFKEYECIIDEYNFMAYDTEDKPVLSNCLNNADSFYYFIEKGAKINSSIIIKQKMLSKAVTCQQPDLRIIKTLIKICSESEEGVKSLKDFTSNVLPSVNNADISSLFSE